MVFNQLAAGRKVYGNGSYAPNRGRLAAKGYVQRSLRKQVQGPYGGVSKVGADGKSDTRSGIAARIVAQKKKPLQGGILKPATQGYPTPAKPPAAPAAPAPVTGAPVPNNPGSPTPTTGDPVPAFQPIQINANGTLDLPYDSQTSADLLAQKEAANQALLDLQAGEQENELDYSQGTRDLERNFEDVRRAAINQAAGRGTAFSSAYGVQVGRNATDYNNQKSDLLSNYSGFKSNAEKQRMGIVNTFNDWVRKNALDRAASEAENAANYSTSTPVGGTKDPGPLKKPTKPTPKKTGKTRGSTKKPQNKPRPNTHKKPKPKAGIKASAHQKAAAKKIGSKVASKRGPVKTNKTRVRTKSRNGTRLQPKGR